MTASDSRSRIVVGLDGSEASQAALRWALDEAVVRGAVLDVVHAWGMHASIVSAPTESARYQDAEAVEQAAEALLEREIAAASSGRRSLPMIERRLERGAPATVLLEAARDADLLVVGTRTFNGKNCVRIGSVSSYCIHHARCPVVVVHPDDEAG